MHLTEKEIEVLVLVAQGMNNEQIGKQIFVTSHTVKAHISAIIRKLGVANRTEAIYVAMKNNIIN